MPLPSSHITGTKEKNADPPFCTGHSSRVSLCWSDITYDIPLAKGQMKAIERQADDVEQGSAGESPALAGTHRRILSGVAGKVNRGEVVAILGASGAGKTTLLNILSARLGSVGKLQGNVLFHDKPRDPQTWKRTVGFVEQEDIMLGHLTVQETLDYAARMRLADNLYSRKEKAGRVEATIEMLRLQRCKDTRIGTSSTRGVSGGERKRTGIGIELVSDVSLLLLDEPTSGLDAYAAYSVVEHLCKTARFRQLACLMTIHQPSWALLMLVDRVQLLAQGSVYYEGRPGDMLAWFGSLGYEVPAGANPADYFITLAENLEGEDEERVRTLIQAWRNREETADDSGSQSHEPGTERSGEGSSVADDALREAYTVWPSSWPGEVAALTSRNVVQLVRDRETIFGVIGQTVVILLIVGFAFFRLGHSQADVLARIGVLFFLVININFSVSGPVVTPFPVQRAVMIRERSAGTYRASSFYLSKLLVDVPINVVRQAPFFLLFYWMVGLKDSAAAFFTFLGLTSLQVIVAVCLGTFIGSVSPSIQLANILAPMISIIFLLFGGNLLPSPPPWFIWLHYISPLTYGYMALAQVEFTGASFTCTDDGSQCYTTGEQVLQQYHLGVFNIGQCAGFLLAIAFAFAALGYLGIRITAHPRFRYS